MAAGTVQRPRITHMTAKKMTEMLPFLHTLTPPGHGTGEQHGQRLSMVSHLRDSQWFQLHSQCR